MTVKQFQHKIAIARKYGKAILDNGSVLYFHGREWAIWNNGQCVDVAYQPEKFYYLFS